MAELGGPKNGQLLWRRALFTGAGPFPTLLQQPRGSQAQLDANTLVIPQLLRQWAEPNVIIPNPILAGLLTFFQAPAAGQEFGALLLGMNSLYGPGGGTVAAGQCMWQTASFGFGTPLETNIRQQLLSLAGQVGVGGTPVLTQNRYLQAVQVIPISSGSNGIIDWLGAIVSALAIGPGGGVEVTVSSPLPPPPGAKPQGLILVLPTAGGAGYAEDYGDAAGTDPAVLPQVSSQLLWSRRRIRMQAGTDLVKTGIRCPNLAAPEGFLNSLAVIPLPPVDDWVSGAVFYDAPQLAADGTVVVPVTQESPTHPPTMLFIAMSSLAGPGQAEEYVADLYANLVVADGARFLFRLNDYDAGPHPHPIFDFTGNGTVGNINDTPAQVPGIVAGDLTAPFSTNFNPFIPIAAVVRGSDTEDFTVEFVLDVGSVIGPGTERNDFGDNAGFYGGQQGTQYFFGAHGSAGFPGIGIATPPGTIQNGQKYHLVFVCRSSNLEIWVNAQLVAGPTPVVLTGTPLSQQTWWATNTQWDGTLQEFAMYHLALTPAQIAAHFAAI